MPLKNIFWRALWPWRIYCYICINGLWSRMLSPVSRNVYYSTPATRGISRISRNSWIEKSNNALQLRCNMISSCYIKSNISLIGQLIINRSKICAVCGEPTDIKLLLDHQSEIPMMHAWSCLVHISTTRTTQSHTLLLMHTCQSYVSCSMKITCLNYRLPVLGKPQTKYMPIRREIYHQKIRQLLDSK